MKLTRKVGKSETGVFLLAVNLFCFGRSRRERRQVKSISSIRV